MATNELGFQVVGYAMNTTIGFIGTGLMGLPMVKNLLGAGYQVTVWNRTREKAEPLAPLGATVADTAADAARGSQIVVTMLEDGPVVSHVLFERGVAGALGRGSMVIDMSSIPPSTARRHAERLGELDVSHLDAPVSGGTIGACDGALAIMVGGDKALFEVSRPVFKPMGRATYVGPAGSGQLAKLANQAIVGITIGAVAEALLLAQTGGADPAAVRDAIGGGFAESRILAEHGRRMLDRNFEPGGRVSAQLKDLKTVLQTAAELKLELPASKLICELFQNLADAGSVDLDHSALLLQLEAMQKNK